MATVVQLLVLFFGGIAALVLLALHPAGPAIFILALSPFDNAIRMLLGYVGNMIALPPFLFLLIRPPPGGWIDAFFGTRAQRAVAIYVVVIVISHVKAYIVLGLPALINYLAKLSTFAIVAIVTAGLRQPRQFERCIRVYVLATTAYVILAMGETYLGIQLLPLQGVHGEEGVLRMQLDERTLSRSFRLVGLGRSLGPNQLAILLFLPISFAASWAHRGQASRLSRLGLFCFAVLLLALVLTISRSSYFGFATGAAVVLVTVFRFDLGRLAAVGMLGFVLLVGGSWLLPRLDLGAAAQERVGAAISERLSTESATSMADNRLRHWAHGMRLFLDAPLTGVGYRVGETERVPAGGLGRTTDPHNAYIRLLAWSGVLGFSAYVYLLWTILSTLLPLRRATPEPYRHWTPFVLGAFVAIAVQFLAVSYEFMLPMFLIAAFCGALEKARRAEQVQTSPQVATWREQGMRQPGEVPPR